MTQQATVPPLLIRPVYCLKCGQCSFDVPKQKYCGLGNDKDDSHNYALEDEFIARASPRARQQRLKKEMEINALTCKPNDDAFCIKCGCGSFDGKLPVYCVVGHLDDYGMRCFVHQWRYREAFEHQASPYARLIRNTYMEPKHTTVAEHASHLSATQQGWDRAVTWLYTTAGEAFAEKRDSDAKFLRSIADTMKGVGNIQ